MAAPRPADSSSPDSQQKKPTPDGSVDRDAAPPNGSDPVSGTEAAANLDAAVQLLRRHFGFDRFRPGQEQVISHLMAGRSSAAVFPTGGGKSLCYQLPSLVFPGTTIVVSPLIALMKDQIDALASRGIPAVRLDSTLTSDEYRVAQDRLRGGALKLLYVSPERFNNERFRELLRQLKVSLFAVDEAHCISEWGHNFRPDYLKLVRYADMCGAERCLALTATATERVMSDICREFKIAPECAIRTQFYRPNLHLRVTETCDANRDDQLVDRVQTRPSGSTIVYVTLQRTAESVAAMLASRGLSSRAYHAGMDSDVRADTQEWFTSSNDGIIVATIAFGMGIDKPNIRYVYHYNLSKSVENYAQEIGRSGRDGQESICETFLCWDDLSTLENFVVGDTPTRSALHSFVNDIFSRDEQFAVSHYRLSKDHELRPLVVRTLLTYLELNGYLVGGTPYYAEYRFKPKRSSQEILGHFDADRRAFLASVLRHARPTKIWLSLDVDETAVSIGADRSRVIRALDYLAEKRWIDLKAGQVLYRYSRLQVSESNVELSDKLFEDAQRRERSELARLHQLSDLLSARDCMSAALARHFGETMEDGCGHCGACNP